MSFVAPNVSLSVPIMTEFNASNAIVASALTDEAFGVARNGISAASSWVPQGSSAFQHLQVAFAPCAVLQGVLMAGIGISLLPGCITRVQEAFRIVEIPADDLTVSSSSNHSFSSAVVERVAETTAGFEEKWLSVANLVDKIFLTAIGFVLVSMGVLAVLSAQGVAADSDFHIASLVFCSIVSARGLEMVMRGGYTLFQIQQFQDEFVKKLEEESAETVLLWLKDQLQKDPSVLKNRIGEDALESLRQWNDLSSEEDMKACLQKVDCGICEEKLKQQLITSVGVLMLIGGVIGIPSCAIGGVPALATKILNTVSSGVSLSMEALWMPYDNPSWFKKLVEWKYSQSHHKELIEKLSLSSLKNSENGSLENEIVTFDETERLSVALPEVSAAATSTLQSGPVKLDGNEDRIQKYLMITAALVIFSLIVIPLQNNRVLSR